MELHYDIAPEVPEPMEGDPGRPHQIVLNLVSDAIKFPHQGEVTLKVELENADGENRVILFACRGHGYWHSGRQANIYFSPASQ